MKKTFIAIATMLAIVAGCTKNDPQAKVSDGKIRATIEDAGTKATLYDDVAASYIVWQAEDTISLFDGVSNIKCTLASEAGRKFGEFTPASTPEPASTYYSVFPYKAENALADGTLTVTYPSSIVYDATTLKAESGANIMVAKAAGTELNFKNLCGYIKFTVTGQEGQLISKVLIKGVGDQAVAGPATVTFEGEVPSVTFNEEGKVNTVTASFGDGLDLATPQTFTVAVAPVFANGFTAIVCLADGSSQELSSATTVGRNEIVTMPEFAFSAKDVAQIGDTKYKSLSLAIAAANASENDVTIKMIENAVSSFTDTIKNVNGKIVTLDLNDCTISGHLYESSILYSYTDLVIEDNGVNKTGCIENTCDCTSSRILMTQSVASKSLTVNGGTFKSRANQGVFYCRFGNVVINGGNFINTRAEGGYGFYMYLAAANVTINGGAFIDLNGGEASAFRAGAATVAIKGGYFHNGTSTGEVVDATGNTAISDGYFSKAPLSKLLAQSYEVKDISASPEVKTIDGTDYTFNYTIAESADKNILDVNGTKYETVAAALSAVNESTEAVTMKVLKNINLDKVMDFTNATAAVTLDLNGNTIYAPWPESKTYSTPDTVALIIQTDGVNLTICDNSASGEGAITQSKANNTSYAIAVNAGTLNITSGTISNSSSTGYGRVAMRVRGRVAACTVNISGGYVYGGRAIVLGSGSSSRKTTVNITGGKVEGLYDTSTTSNYSTIGWGGSYGILNVSGDAYIIANDAPLIYCGYNSSEIHITKSGEKVPHFYRNAFESENKKFFSTGNNQKTFFKELECYTNSTTVSHDEILTTSGATAHEVTEVYDGKTFTNYFYKE